MLSKDRALLQQEATPEINAFRASGLDLEIESGRKLNDAWGGNGECRLAKVKTVDGSNWNAEVDAIEGIEKVHLDPELILLVDREALDNGEVVLDKAGTCEAVPRYRPLSASPSS